MARQLKVRRNRAAAMAHTAVLCAATALLLSGCDALVTPDRRVERAQAHLAKGQFRPAMTELKTALEREPGHAAARLALAELWLWLGDVEDAAAEIERAEKASANPEQLRPTQYEILFRTRKFEELQRALEQDQSSPKVRRLVLEARAAGALGNATRAQEKLQAALAAAPDDAEALLESARLAIARDDLDPALELPARLAKADDVMRARALVLRGTVLLKRGEYPEARAALGEAVQVGSRMPVPEQFEAAAALTETDLALNDAAAAEKSLAGVTRWSPDSLPAHYFKARIAMLKSEYSLAVAECQRALRAQPEHAQSQLLLAAAHTAQGSSEQAVDVLTRLLASNPGNASARKLLAQVYLARNEAEKAQRLLGPTEAEADPELEWLRGAALLRTGQTASGLEHLERGLASAPDDIARRLDLATAYIAAGMAEKALELLAAAPPTPDSAAAGRVKVLQVLAAAAGKPRADARKEIDALLGQHPRDAMLATAAGAYLTSVGEVDAGRGLLNRVLELDARSVEARLALARLEGVNRNLVAAERRLKEVLQIDPANQAAHIGLAELAWATGDRALAQRSLESAVSADPGALDARLRLAQISFLQGDAARARGLLDQAVSVAKDRKTVLRPIGDVLARAGFSDEALDRYREAAAAGDKSARLSAARLHLELGRKSEARKEAEAALKERPKWREAEQMLVLVDAQGGRIEQAFERARRLSGQPTAAGLKVIEGDIYMAAGQPQAALAAYESAHSREPSAATAIKVFTLRRAGGAADPERSLRQWLEGAPQDVQVRRLLAAHYEATGDVERAIAQYERLASDGKADAVMLNNFAWLLHQKSDPRALEIAQRAYAAAPQLAEISDTYGWILVRMGKVPEGIPVLEKALARASGNPEIQYHAAFAYAKSGQKGRAADLLRKSLQATQPYPSRAAAEQLLQSIAEQTS